jgi:hypothetical protein
MKHSGTVHPTTNKLLGILFLAKDLKLGRSLGYSIEDS